MKRALAGLAAALALAAGISAYAVTRPDPQTQAVADGCGRNDSAAIQNLVPEWAYIGDRDSPASGPPPAPQWLRGVVNGNGNSPLAVHVAGGDIPTTHDSYDVNIDVLPDPEYAFLIGGDPTARTGNFEDDVSETGRVHTELESDTFPAFAWPEPGDRVTMIGDWVWDCGHWEPGGERTEIHPIRAVWTVRSPSPRSPNGDAEGDLVLTNDNTGAGRVADCAHETKPQGPSQALKDCIARSSRFHDVTGTYTFLIAAPPRPAPNAKLRARVLDAGSTAGAPPLAVRTTAAGAEVSLTIPPSAGPAARLLVARRVYVGWRPAPRAEHLRVRFVRLLVRRAMDPGTPQESTHLQQTSKLPGEWNVYWDVAGIWSMWDPRSLLVRRDGQAFAGRQTVDLYVPPGRPWRVFVWARECDFGALGSMDFPNRPLWPCPPNAEFGERAGDDVPGPVIVRFRSPAAALGLHSANAGFSGGSTCPRSNRHGCYQVTFRVSRVQIG